MFKKVRSAISVLLSITLCVSLFLGMYVDVYATGNENTEEGTVIVAEFVKELDGTKYYRAPISMDANPSMPSARSADLGDIVMMHHGDGLWEVLITINAPDGIKYMRGTCSTYGPWGNGTNPFSADNFIPFPVISTSTSFLLKPHIAEGTQFFKISGTVTGVYGGMSFGPTIYSAQG